MLSMLSTRNIINNYNNTYTVLISPSTIQKIVDTHINTPTVDILGFLKVIVVPFPLSRLSPIITDFMYFTVTHASIINKDLGGSWLPHCSAPTQVLFA